jgi:hypothetical protein
MGAKDGRDCPCAGSLWEMTPARALVFQVVVLAQDPIDFLCSIDPTRRVCRNSAEAAPLSCKDPSTLYA